MNDNKNCTVCETKKMKTTKGKIERFVKVVTLKGKGKTIIKL